MELHPSVVLLQQIQQRHIEKQQVLADRQLPLWPEPVRAAPNGVLRSALFGAIRRGKRKFIQGKSIACITGVAIVYTGPQLDQSDLDVWLGVLHLARQYRLGNRIEFTEKGFLRLLGRGGPNGRSIGKSDRVWLRRSLTRLKATAVEVTQGPHTYCGSLLDEYYRDSNLGRYVIALNPKMKEIFGYAGWTKIDWNVRHGLAGNPLAQWLHGFYSTHAEPYDYSVETLHRLCGSEAGIGTISTAERNKAISDWTRSSLRPALALLATVSVCNGQPFVGEVDDNRPVVHMQRELPASPRKARAFRHPAHTKAPPIKPGGIEFAHRGDRTRRRGDSTRDTGG